MIAKRHGGSRPGARRCRHAGARRRVAFGARASGHSRRWLWSGRRCRRGSPQRNIIICNNNMFASAAHADPHAAAWARQRDSASAGCGQAQLFACAARKPLTVVRHHVGVAVTNLQGIMVDENLQLLQQRARPRGPPGRARTRPRGLRTCTLDRTPSNARSSNARHPIRTSLERLPKLTGTWRPPPPPQPTVGRMV